MSDPFEDLELRAIQLQQRTTNPDLPSALPLKPEHTHTGLGPPGWQSAPGAPGMAIPPPRLPGRHADPPERRRWPEPPPRSITPSPESGPAVLDVPGMGTLKVHRSLFRRVAPWLAPVVISAAGAGIGYVRAYAAGLVAAAERMAAAEEKLRLEGERRARIEVLAKQASEDLDQAFAVNRAQDERVGRIDERLKRVEELVIIKPK